MEPKKRKQRKRNSSGIFVKVIILGDSGVGKTCLINRYIGGCYQDSFAATLGVDFKIKPLEVNDTKINLQIWDTAGQQRYKTITKSYFQGCLGVLLVFSLTDLSSFQGIQRWLQQLQQNSDQRKIIKLLVGTKVDCPDQRVVQVNQCSQLALKYDLEYFQVSAKTGYNVSSIFETIVDKIMTRSQSTVSQFFRQKSIKLKSFSNQSYLRNCQC